MRRTPQREAILLALERTGRPLSPQELHREAAAQAPGLGIATVYRNVRRLLAEGAIRPVDLPGAPSRYEVAGKGHHHHFHCRRCDRVFEVEECPGSIQELAPNGFRLEHHEIVLYGVCEGCA